MERTCGNCKWFRPEPGVLVDRDSPANYVRKLRMPYGGRVEDGGSTSPPVYGKCTAQYLGKDGQPKRFDTGNFSSTPCNATNDAGVPLFQSGTFYNLMKEVSMSLYSFGPKRKAISTDFDIINYEQLSFPQSPQ